MDHLLHETDGGRRMANQIVRQVFRQPSCKEEKVITGAKVRLPHLFRFFINKHTKKERFHVAPGQPYLCSKVMKWRPYCCTKRIFSYGNGSFCCIKFACALAT